MLDSDTYLQPSDGVDCRLIEIGPEKYILNANSFGLNSQFVGSEFVNFGEFVRVGS